MNQDVTQQINNYLGLFLRRKKLIISCFFLSIVIGVGIYLKTPKVYESASMIIYQQQSINQAKKSLDVKAHIHEVVSTVSQQVTSRSSLEELIKRHNLYTDLQEKLPMEDVVGVLRGQITIKPAQQGDIFYVSFRGGEPNTVKLVTNALASKFIEENLRFREEQASETSAYVKDELNMAKESLDKKEAIMRDYKLQFYNEMPQQLQINMTRLNALQAQNQNNQASIQDLERTRVLVQEQITLRKEMLRQAENRARDMVLAGKDPNIAGNDLGELERVRINLEALRAKYTAQHPEVKRAEKLLAQLEKNREERLASSTEPTSNNPQLDQLERQLREIEYNVENLRNEREEIQKQIERYKQWVAAAPVREAEWSALTRDYNQLNNHYQDLVSRSLQAEATESLERRQKGSQFKIVDPAHFPEKPIQPDFARIMLLALLLGAGMGCGLALGLEALDTSFKDPTDVENFLGLPVVTSIPVVSTPREKMVQKVKTVFWTSLFILSSLTILAGMIYLFGQGYIII